MGSAFQPCVRQCDSKQIPSPLTFLPCSSHLRDAFFHSFSYSEQPHQTFFTSTPTPYSSGPLDDMLFPLAEICSFCPLPLAFWPDTTHACIKCFSFRRPSLTNFYQTGLHICHAFSSYHHDS